jgi:ABC-type multidrug transport system fused ATPase/permease subunit
MFNIYINNKIDQTIHDTNNIESKYATIKQEYNKKMINFIIVIRVMLYLFLILSIGYLYLTKHVLLASLSTITYLYITRVDSMLEILPNNIMKLFDINDTSKSYITNTNHFESYPNIIGHLEIKDITFFYKSNPHHKIFDHYSLEIKQVERICMIGQTGKGKSTLVKLFLRFYEAQEGDIFIDGKNIKLIDPDDIRKNIYYINQKTVLFNDSILENLRYGTNISEEDVYSFLKKYDLFKVFEKVDTSDNCLSFMIDNNGSTISMGMQKVIFLVRGMLQNVPVYFIDEPFTSIDEDTRDCVQNMIDKETKGKTVLIITHDVKGLDTILDRMISL